ncbi:hypothetical protein [Streptomyces caatingaensis]|uniref:Large membrane protein n=1 Tax=Streptomyces caatingaensis TaxID=1678637 RepID=A0A0K9XI95_9ACTN|nr:hypothetical protein [Streptomyces caatingaensis]KNB52756.1 hypothetical protein AC230_08900 [Streptomyces caatingaensis]
MGTEDGTSGTRRRAYSPPVVASVAAAVLLAGGGGAYWAVAAGDDDGTPAPAAARGTPPPLALDGSGPAPAGGPGPGIAVGEPDPGGTRYRAAGRLPEGPRSAAVHLSSGEVTRDEVARLARALGVAGEPRLADGLWTVGGRSGPMLRVGAKGPGNWSYSRYGLAGGTPCVHPGKDTPGEGAPPCPSHRDRPGGSDPAASRPVPEERARAAARPVLEALGLKDAKVGADRVFGAVRSVTADPVVDGLPTYGWQTALQVAADGRLSGGSGQVRLPAKGHDYPVVSAARALEELNRAGAPARPRPPGDCATPVPLGTDGAAAPCGSAPPARDPVVIRGATFALSGQSVGGRPALVPSWLFAAEVGGGATVTLAQPAVDPAYLVKGAGPKKPSPAAPAHVTSYRTDGKRLTLRFWGGMCSDYAASAVQSAAAVTVKVTGTEREPGRPCVLAAREYDRNVALEEPLDGRKVVDVLTGEPVPRG